MGFRNLLDSQNQDWVQPTPVSAIAKTKDTLNWQQYFADHPGTAENYGGNQDGAWQAYSEGNTGGAQFIAPKYDANSLSPIYSNPNDLNSPIQGYIDQRSEIIYDSNTPDAKMIVPGSINEDPYINAVTELTPMESYQRQAQGDSGAQTADDTLQRRIAAYNLQKSNPTEFYTKAATNLANDYAQGSSYNWQGMGAGGLNKDALQSSLDNLKNIDPKAYYTGQLIELSKLTGWDYGQNTPERSASRIQQIKDMAPAAIAAGIDPNQLSSLVNSNFSDSAQNNATRIANEASNSQGTLAGLPQFAATVAGLGLGLGGLIGAFAPAALAPEAVAGATGGIAEGSTASTLPSLSWTAPEIGGIGSTGSTFGTLNAALPAVGSVGGAGAGMSAALPAGTMIGDGTLGTTMGMSYMEAAPGQFALDSFGNPIQASSIGIGGYAPTGTSLSDALNTANDARKAYNLANSVARIGGGNSGVATGGTTGGSTSGTSGTDLSKLASLLTAKNTYQPIELAQLQTKNPFLFTSPGQTQASQGMYDVSGSNLANALRKA